MRKIFLLFSVLLMFTITVQAQNRTITGTVTSKDDNGPLVGVTIQVKGSQTATATDANGNYSIKVTNLQNVVIGAKFLGFDYQEVTLKPGEKVLNFKLATTTNSLSEVVVVGYGEQKKITMTGAVETIPLKAVQDIPALSLSSALSGTVPGLSVSGGNVRPGQPTTITIRNPIGFAKDGVGIAPLYVIDDVIRSQADFDALDINEIEAISVLKDAESAIYGVSGGNGVIVVRTKRGHSGSPKFSFSSSVGQSNATMLPKMMSGLQLGTFMDDYYQASVYQQTAASWTALGVGQPVGNFYDADGYLHTVFPAANAGVANTRSSTWYTPDELAYFAANNNNYMAQAFKAAYVEREALNITGGSDKTTYFIGGDYVNQNSNFSGVNSNKYGLRANVDTKPAKGLDVFMALSDDISSTKSYWYKLKSTSESLQNDAISLENVQPWQKYFINGNPVDMGGSTTGGYDNINFFALQNTGNFTSGVNYVMNMLGKITYDIPGIKGLTATATFNENINSANNKQFGTEFTYYKYAGLGENNHIPGGALTGTYTIDNGNTVRLNPVFATNYQLDAGLNYNRSFGKSTISALFLYEQREQMSEGVAAESDGVVAGGLPYQTFTTGATQSSNQSSQVSQAGFESYISRVNYSYDNKYLAQIVYRADGSSYFQPGYNWGSFPEGSVGWVISEEPFLKNKYTWLDLVKVRASAGLTGTNNTKAYQYQASYNLGTGSSGGAVFGEADRTTGVKGNVILPNSGVTWDHVFKTNYGLDLAFLKNRLSVTGDYFWDHGYDYLTTITSAVPATVGAPAPTENFSIANNFGYEISVGWRDHIGKKFTYSFTPFFQWSDNKIIKTDVSSGNVGTVLDPTGKSSDQGVFGYKSLGLIRTQAQANAIIASRAAAAGGASKVTILGYPVQPGMINYADLNGDGIISTDNKDQEYVKPKSSNHNSMGLNWSVGYGGFNLNVIMGMSWGGWSTIDGLKPSNQSSSSTNASIADNRPVYWADHWTPTNTNAKYPNPYFANDYQVTTDFWLVSATNINITSANLSYTVPVAFTSRIGVASARLYVVGTNLIQFLNPYPDQYRDFSTDVYAYPGLRTISLGLNVGF